MCDDVTVNFTQRSPSSVNLAWVPKTARVRSPEKKKREGVRQWRLSKFSYKTRSFLGDAMTATAALYHALI